jgi:capsular polysaccharide export protein
VIRGGLSAFKGKRVLLLQGPLGPFFSRLAQDLTQAGAVVSKINFNGGDWFFSPKNAINFRGDIEQWPKFFEQVLSEQQIDMVLLLGDCRAMHRIAHEIADQRGLEIGVFEEGYVRPDYITLERYGVNGHSQIPRDPAFYLEMPDSEVPQTINVGNTFWYGVWWTMVYYWFSALLWPIFNKYQHHRPLTLLEALLWVKGSWRKHYFAHKERGIQDKLATTLSGQYFLAVLQVHNDAQMHVHSNFDSVPAFIESVIHSFAQFSAVDSYLVIKHHPMDRAYNDYSSFIEGLLQKHKVQNRVLYIHDQHLPTVLEHARGVVLVNSTVGLSALHYGTPLMVCGEAIYDLAGLAFQGPLANFWKEAGLEAMNRDLYQRFRNYLIKHTQLNGSFYRRLKLVDSVAGLVWAQASTGASEEIDGSTLVVNVSVENKPNIAVHPSPTTMPVL